MSTQNNMAVKSAVEKPDQVLYDFELKKLNESKLQPCRNCKIGNVGLPFLCGSCQWDLIRANETNTKIIDSLRSLA